MRIKTLLLASIFISFGFGSGSTKPIDFDQGWYQFFKKPIKRHFYSSNQVPINGSILLDKLREILLLENKEHLFMEAGTVDIPKSKHHNSADPLMDESMPNEDNSSSSVDKFLKDFIDIGVVLKDLVEENRPIPTKTTYQYQNWAFPLQRM